MSVVARGHVSSRPFARSVHWIAAKQFTGDLVMTQDSMTYRVTWRRGMVTAAHSSSPADACGRIAMTAGMASSTQVGEVLRRAGQQPEAEQIAMLAELAGLARAQIVELKRRILGHRTLRIFGLEQASFVLENTPTLASDPDAPPLNGRWIIYHGVRGHYSEQRLDRELAPAASAHLRLTAEDQLRLGDFGFSPADRRSLTRLSEQMGEHGLTLDQIPAVCPELPRKVVLSMVYALLATDGITAVTQQAPAGQAPGPAAGQALGQTPGQAPGHPASHAPAGQSAPPRMSVFTPGFGVPTLPRPGAPGPSDIPGAPSISRTSIPSPAFGTAQVPQAPQVPRTAPMPVAQPAGSPGHAARGASRAPQVNAGAADASPGNRSVTIEAAAASPASQTAIQSEIRQLIQDKLQELDRGADYYQLLGVDRSVPDTEIRKVYFDLARKLHPDRLRAVGIMDLAAESQRLFSQINQAFAVLGNAKKRAQYMEALRSERKGAKQAGDQAESYAARVLAAEEHFLRGEMALRRQIWADALAEFKQAMELNPGEADHIVMLGWATWCAADDKSTVLAQVQDAFKRALEMAPKNVRALYYSGRVASTRGEYRAALELFQRVLKHNPHHQEAALEARVLQGRLSKGDKGDDKGGLLKRLKRR